MHLLHYKINVSYMHGRNCVRGNIIYIILIQMTIKFYMYIQIATQGILKYCLRGFMAKQQRDTLFFFLDVLTRVLQETHAMVDLDNLEQDMNTALALIERDFPVSTQVR